MKKILVIISTTILALSFAGFAFAENAVSEMAVAKSGLHIAQCAQMMDKGISECAKMDVCQHIME